MDGLVVVYLFVSLLSSADCRGNHPLSIPRHVVLVTVAFRVWKAEIVGTRG